MVVFVTLGVEMEGRLLAEMLRTASLRSRIAQIRLALVFSASIQRASHAWLGAALPYCGVFCPAHGMFGFLFWNFIWTAVFISGLCIEHNIIHHMCACMVHVQYYQNTYIEK